MSLKSKIQALITAANAKTGETDATLTDAVQTLVDGYGQGGGDFITGTITAVSLTQLTDLIAAENIILPTRCLFYFRVKGENNFASVYSSAALRGYIVRNGEETYGGYTSVSRGNIPDEMPYGYVGGPQGITTSNIELMFDGNTLISFAPGSAQGIAAGNRIEYAIVRW